MPCIRRSSGSGFRESERRHEGASERCRGSDPPRDANARCRQVDGCATRRPNRTRDQHSASHALASSARGYDDETADSTLSASRCELSDRRGAVCDGDGPVSRDHDEVRIGPCGKKVYRNERHARRAHGKAHYRVRVYWCHECKGHHATASEKRRGD